MANLKTVQIEDESFENDEVEGAFAWKDLGEPRFLIHLSAFVGFFLIVTIIRIVGRNRMKALTGYHTVEMSALNDCKLFQDLFISYLSAAILEPILAIAGMEEVKGDELFINLCELLAILWWMWLLNDAFDSEDVMQCYTYHVKLKEEKDDESTPEKKYPWIQFKDPAADAQSERRTLLGTARRDVALWFCLAMIAEAWMPSDIGHRDVMHAYVIVLFWLRMHWLCRQATTWGTGYLISLLFPSTALMPLEYCFPLVDSAEDMEFLESYRNYVTQRTGVEMIISS